jgi:hypothetical protein
VLCESNNTQRGTWYKKIKTSEDANSWQKDRSKEAKDKIYRIPPPGNTILRQVPITNYFQNMSLNCTTNASVTPKNNHIINILQWNACSLNEAKAAELSDLAKKRKIDIKCISELGNRRKIKGFPNYSQCQSDTPSAIFWRPGLHIKNITPQINIQIPRIQLHCVEIEEEFTIIHTYIPPDVGFRERRQLWSAIYQLLLNEKIIWQKL